jgi:hypothetical protein
MRVLEYSGEWDELESLGVGLLAQSGDRPGAEYVHLELAVLAALRGQVGTARQHLAGMESWQRSDRSEPRWTYAACEATIAVAAGQHAHALELLSATLREIAEIEGPSSQASRIGFPQALSAAFTLGRLVEAEELLTPVAEMPPGHVPAYARAHIARGRGLLAAARGEVATAETQLGLAIERLTALRYPYWLAVVQTDLVGVLIDDHRPTEARPLLDEARTTFAGLGASPALQRVEDLVAGRPVPARS